MNYWIRRRNSGSQFDFRRFKSHILHTFKTGRHQQFRRWRRPVSLLPQIHAFEHILTNMPNQIIVNIAFLFSIRRGKSYSHQIDCYARWRVCAQSENKSDTRYSGSAIITRPGGSSITSDAVCWCSRRATLVIQFKYYPVLNSSTYTKKKKKKNRFTNSITARWR